MRFRPMAVTVVAMFFVLGATELLACPPGQYADNLGICWPYGSTVTNAVVSTVNQLPDAVKVGDAVIHFDAAKLTQAVGHWVVKTGGGPATGIAAELMLDEPTRAQVDTLVGRGWLVFVKGNPDFMGVLANGIEVKDHPLEEPPVTMGEAPKPRKVKHYESTAFCAVALGSRVTAGWVEAPVLIDKSSGEKFTYPTVDLQNNDTIEVKTSDQCAGPQKKELSLASAKLKFEYSSTVPGVGATNMKYFVVGSLISRSKG